MLAGLIATRAVSSSLDRWYSLESEALRIAMAYAPEGRMNYYEHHIGDYDEATAHLTACEDGIYSRLIRKYYSGEKPLPNDIPALQRLVRARSRDEKAAVKTILEEFFELREDGWHQKRCDEDLARYLDKKRKAQASANARWTNREPQSERNANASDSDMRTDSERNANASQTHDERNAHQTPDTRHHKNKNTARVPRFDAQAHLVSLGIPIDLAKDWLAVRKAKRLAPTATAFDDAKAEADKAGIPFSDALRTCIVRGWGGFKASWLDERPSGRVNGHDSGDIFG